MNQPRRLLFICLGNICRSPTAEALCRQRLEQLGMADQFEVSSAGIIARGNDVATLEAIQVAGNHGVDVRKHLSTTLTAELLEAAYLVVAMDRMNVEHILNLVPDLGSRLRLLSSFDADREPGAAVQDPIGQPLSFYDETYRQIEAGIDGLIRELTATAGQPPARSTTTGEVPGTPDS